MGSNRPSSLLRNDYYIGVVRYAGKSYRGRRAPLIAEGVFQKAQGILAAQRQSGERSWRHHHYLRGSLFYAECGGRLFFTQAKGNGGVYEYFICAGRSKGTSQPSPSPEPAPEVGPVEERGK